MPHHELMLGEVIDRNDPEDRCRIRVLVPGFYEPQSPWAMPMGMPGAGGPKQGRAEAPPKHANVFVQCLNGDPNYPVWSYGPPGMPDGVNDAPTDHATDGDTTQAVAEEDSEWKVTRDDRSGNVGYLIKHKSSGLALFLDGDAGKIYVVDAAATQAMVRGTEYRAAEAAYLTGLVGAIVAFANTAKTATTVAQIATAAGTLWTLLNVTGLPSPEMADDATEYLSEDAFVE